MNDNRSIRDQLLSVEPIAPDARNQLQQEIHDMFIKKLSVPRKIFVALVMLFALASACVCGALAITEPDLPPLARIALATGSLMGLAWVASFGLILRRGEIDLKRDHRRTAQMVWVFTLLMVVFFLIVGMTAADAIKGVMMIAQSLAFLIGAAVYWINYRIDESELNLKEQLLRLELQLAETAKKRS